MLARTLTSILAIAWATGAHAQTTATAQAPAKADADAVAIEDIIVTAQRRSERLIDVPITISAASSEDLERAGGTSLENLTRVIPGVYIQRAVYGLSPTIRGIGSTLSSSGGEQNVSIYVDGVYQPTASGNVFDLASVAGVEVLKGPQGTLFGRNATGGALLIRTLDPDFVGAAKYNVSYERFGQLRTSAYVNVPLTDTLAANGSLAFRHSDGYIRDMKTDELVNEGQNFTARGKLLWQPTDNFSAILTVAHSNFDDPTGSSAQSAGPAPAYLLPSVNAGPIAYDRFHLSHNTRNIIQTEANSAALNLKLDTSYGTWTAITAYQENHLASQNDLDATYATTPAPITLPPPLPPIVVGVIPTNQYVSLEVNTRTFTQEINFASDSDGPFNYVVGAFYFKNSARVPGLYQNGAPSLHASGSGSSYAVYADGTYKIGQLSLIGGLRYTSEERESANGNGAVDPTPFTRFQTGDDSQVTPRIGARYALSPQSNIYATYTKGFKSGVFDSTTPNGPAVKAEMIDAYEIGYKTNTGRFSLNAAAFYYDFQDTQVNATISGSTGIFSQLYNVPSSRIYGLDLDGTLYINDSFDIRAAVAYTKAQYMDFAFAPTYAATNGASTGFGLVYETVISDASGNNMVRAPEFTASASFNYHANIGENARLDVAVSPYYSSEVFFDFANKISQDDYVTVDATATVTFNESLKVSVFGRNLGDEIYRIGGGMNGLGATSLFGMPRTYGVSLGYSF